MLPEKPGSGVVNASEASQPHTTSGTRGITELQGKQHPAHRLHRSARWWGATVLTYGMLVAGALVMVVPFLFSLLTSFKTPQQFATTDPLSWPAPFTGQNYAEIFGGTTNVLVPIAITVQMVLVMTTVQLACSVLAAYAFARLRFPGKEAIFWAYLATLMVPAIVTMIPLYAMFSKAELNNTFIGLVLPFMLGSPYAIFLLRQNFQAVPQEILDAAKLDGAGHWRTLRSVMLPMNRPIIATLLLITVVSHWNSYLWPSMIAPKEEWRVLTVATQALQGQYTDNWTLIMAATTVALAPLIVLFVVFNKQIVSSLGISGLK